MDIASCFFMSQQTSYFYKKKKEKRKFKKKHHRELEILMTSHSISCNVVVFNICTKVKSVQVNVNRPEYLQFLLIHLFLLIKKIIKETRWTANSLLYLTFPFDCFFIKRLGDAESMNGSKKNSLMELDEI